MIPEDLYELFEDEDPSIEIVEEGLWIGGGKYESRVVIVRQYETYYRIKEMRSGSYYTDYDYERPVITIVKPVTETVTVTKWVKV